MCNPNVVPAREIMTILARLNATIPVPLNEFAKKRVVSGNFSNKSEYIRHLIRQDLEAEKKDDIQLLNKMLKDGEDSGVSPKSPEDLEQSAQAAIKKATSKKK
jgi:antitoxin ParD1/3/4